MSNNLNPNEQFDNDLSKLNTCHKVMFEFRNLLTGIKFEKWYSYFEVILLQYQMKSISLMNLLNGSKYEQMNFVDVPSLFILLRGLIENYLMFYYLYIQPSSIDEIYFLSLIYQHSGLKNRQKYNAIPKDNTILKEEAVEIEQLTLQIHKHPLFNKLNARIRKRIKTKATLTTFLEIIKSSKLNSKNFSTFWQLCSNFAHSEYISGMQIRSIYIDSSQPNDLFNYKYKVLTHSLYLIVQVINDFKDMFIQLDDYYKTNPYDIKSITKEFDISNYDLRFKID